MLYTPFYRYTILQRYHTYLHQLNRACPELVGVVRVVVPERVGRPFAVPVVHPVRQKRGGLVGVGAARAERVQAVGGGARNAQGLLEVIAAATQQPQVRVEASVSWQIGWCAVPEVPGRRGRQSVEKYA